MPDPPGKQPAENARNRSLSTRTQDYVMNDFPPDEPRHLPKPSKPPEKHTPDPYLAKLFGFRCPLPEPDKDDPAAMASWRATSRAIRAYMERQEQLFAHGRAMNRNKSGRPKILPWDRMTVNEVTFIEGHRSMVHAMGNIRHWRKKLPNRSFLLRRDTNGVHVRRER